MHRIDTQKESFTHKKYVDFDVHIQEQMAKNSKINLFQTMEEPKSAHRNAIKEQIKRLSISDLSVKSNYEVKVKTSIKNPKDKPNSEQRNQKKERRIYKSDQIQLRTS